MNRKPHLFTLLLLAIFYGCNRTKPTAKKPNILFAIMDDATYMHMGAYGCKWVHTPNFDRVAKNGLLFKRAYTNNAKCAPSRASILTGRNSWQLEEAANHWPYFPTKYQTFAETLSKQGYFVGYTGKGWSPGVAKNEDGTKRDLLVNAYNKLKTTPPTTSMSTVDYAANFSAFLKEREESQQPFFFWYGGLEPHRAYEYGSSIAKGGKKIEQIPDSDVYDFWPVSDSIKTDLLDYAFEIEYFDKQLGKMLTELEQIGELNNTIIVVTSDNGMPFPRVKGQEYEYSNHLPLAIMWADGIQHPNREVEDYISFIDFAPTFLELAGIDPTDDEMQPIAGKSFAATFQGSQPIRSSNENYVLIGKERHDVGRPHDQGYPIRGIIKEHFLYLTNFKPDRWPAGNPETGYPNTDGSPTKTHILNQLYRPKKVHYWEWSFGKRPAEELYDIIADPDCIKNLVDSLKYRSIQRELKQLLLSKLKEQQDPRILGNGDIFDAYKYSDPGSVNFYERYFNHDKTLRWGWINDSDFQDLSKVPYVKK